MQLMQIVNVSRHQNVLFAFCASCSPSRTSRDASYAKNNMTKASMQHTLQRRTEANLGASVHASAQAAFTSSCTVMTPLDVDPHAQLHSAWL